MKLTITLETIPEIETPEESERKFHFAAGFAKSVREQMATAEGDWGWCTALVYVEYDDPQGRTLRGRASLSGSSYKSAGDFIANSGYFTDLINEALAEIEQIETTFDFGVSRSR